MERLICSKEHTLFIERNELGVPQQLPQVQRISVPALDPGSWWRKAEQQEGLGVDSEALQGSAQPIPLTLKKGTKLRLHISVAPSRVRMDLSVLNVLQDETQGREPPHMPFRPQTQPGQAMSLRFDSEHF